jgi:hypothetical protein
VGTGIPPELEPMVHALARQITTEAETKLDHEYTTYVKTPLVSVLLGYTL